MAIASKIILLFTLGSILLLSCDPAKRIIVKNKTGNNLKVDLNFENCKFSPVTKAIDSGGYLGIQLAKKGESKSKNDVYGFGGWSQEEFENLKSCLTSININPENGIEDFISGEDLNEYIPGTRKGLAKQIFIIKLN